MGKLDDDSNVVSVKAGGCWRLELKKHRWIVELDWM
jgi:hypothetical protein